MAIRRRSFQIRGDSCQLAANGATLRACISPTGSNGSCITALLALTIPIP